MTILGVPEMKHLSSRPRVWLSVETAQILGLESQRGGFWPGLRSLKCNVGWEIVPFISSFVTPTIANLDLTLPRESNRLLQPTLSLLTHICRQLQSLRLDIDAFGSLSGGEIGRLISASRNTLHRIDIRSFTPPDIFPVIFNLTRLRTLVLQEPRLPDQIPSEILPPLEAIDFNGSHGSNLAQFLRSLSTQRLAELSVHCGEIIQLPTLLDSLRGVTATMNRIYLSPVTDLDHSSITLLCTFTNLTSLKIRCACENRKSWPCSFQPTDEDLSKLGESLPHICTLILSPGCSTPRRVTFTSLARLSRVCSNLEILSTRVDFASIVDGSGQPNHDNVSLGGNNARLQREGSRLRTLTVGNSPLPDTPHCEWMVALALASIFPSTKFLFSYCADETHRSWNKVWEDITACQRILHIAQAEGKRLDTYV